MSAPHTPGRLSFEKYEGACYFNGKQQDGYAIKGLEMVPDYEHPMHTEANARRLVACWNACEGIPTEVLEAQQAGGLPWHVADQIEQRIQRDELLAALQAFLQGAKCVDSDGYIAYIDIEQAIAQATAAIAKAGGAA